MRFLAALSAGRLSRKCARSESAAETDNPTVIESLPVVFVAATSHRSCRRRISRYTEIILSERSMKRRSWVVRRTNCGTSYATESDSFQRWLTRMTASTQTALHERRRSCRRRAPSRQTAWRGRCSTLTQGDPLGRRFCSFAAVIGLAGLCFDRERSRYHRFRRATRGVPSQRTRCHVVHQRALLPHNVRFCATSVDTTPL